MSKALERIQNGIVKENPTFVQMLGLCPAMAVTTSAMNGLGMGLITTVILVLSNMMISALRKVIPDKIRIPSYILIIASFVTVAQFLLEGFIPSLYDSLGIYIPLIVVNCIILGRAEHYASKNPVWLSMFDGLGMGLGFTVGLTSIGIIRELFGNGSIFNIRIMPQAYEPVTILILAPGAFFVLACLIAAQNKIRLEKVKKTGTTDTAICETESGCMGCANVLCTKTEEKTATLEPTPETIATAEKDNLKEEEEIAQNPGGAAETVATAEKDNLKEKEEIAQNPDETAETVATAEKDNLKEEEKIAQNPGETAETQQATESEGMQTKPMEPQTEKEENTFTEPENVEEPIKEPMPEQQEDEV